MTSCTLLVDADTMVWKVLTVTNSDGEIPNPDQGCMYFDRLLTSYTNEMSKYFDVRQTQLFMTPDSKTNFRYRLPSVVGYKENRVNQAKPHGFREVKNYVYEHHKAVSDIEYEADDLIAMQAKVLGKDACIVGIDKDYRQCDNVWLWDTKVGSVPEYANTLGFLIKKAHTTKHPNVYGRGLKWFYFQLLVGDSSDNIKGAKGIGPIKAYDILSDASTDNIMYDRTLEKYENDQERLLNNARLLWLRRSKNEPLWEPPCI